MNKKVLEDNVLTIINIQIQLLLDLEEQINKIVDTDYDRNYDYEIMKNSIKITDRKIENYNKLLEEIEEDYKEGFLTKEDYLEYKTEYNTEIKKMNKENKINDVNLKESQFDIKNPNWIDYFRKNNNLDKLTKSVVMS